MIAALLATGEPPRDGAGFARLLEFGAHASSHWWAGDGTLLAQLQSQRHAGWSPGRASGRMVLFNGQFHNRQAIATELGLVDTGVEAGTDDATLYALALDRWGEAADEHVIGHYCAIAVEPRRAGLRLSRSPFLAPPMHFRHDGERAIAASIPRPLFWNSAAPRRVDGDRLARSRLIDFSDRFTGWYEGCGRVPLGSAVILTTTGFHESWRYDLFSRPRLRLPRDEDYVTAANALLDEGVAAALTDSRRPGVLLSGGLDSSQVALSALRLLPAEQKLPAFTYGPEAGWTETPPAGRYASEFPGVAQLAAAYPRLRPEYFTNQGQDFRHRLRELMAAMDCAPPALGAIWAHHDIFERAREQGCDVLLWADWGNLSFSSSAPWAAIEYFRRGRWRRMWQVLRHQPGEMRPMWRRFVARVILPQLPRGLWSRAWRWRRGTPPDGLRASGLSRAWAQRHRLAESVQTAWLDLDRLPITSRRAFWQRLMSEDGQEHEQVVQGMQQLHGVALRDPTAYRPLVEFCYAIPTGQFTRGDMNRFLARRMAAGRLPDGLRLERDLGLHQGDWKLRIGRARAELLDELDRMAGDADIAAMFDLDQLRRSLEAFDPATTGDEEAIVFQSALPMAIAAGRFIAYAKGRNDI